LTLQQPLFSTNATGTSVSLFFRPDAGQMTPCKPMS
jgi:hypothetical protein